MLEFSSFFSYSPLFFFFRFVTILSRHSSRRMRFGRGHSPTQNSHRTCCFFHPPFFIQISIWNEFTGYVRAAGVEDRNLFQIRHAESVSLSNTSRSGLTRPTFHTAVRSISLTRRPTTCCARDTRPNCSDNVYIGVAFVPGGITCNIFANCTSSRLSLH